MQLNKKKLANLEGTIASLKKQYKHAEEEKAGLVKELTKLKSENDKLVNDFDCLESKHKQLKSQKESNNAAEQANVKKMENDVKEKEESIRKLEESKKACDSKLKQLNADFGKQLNANKTLKTENEKLADKLKINEEKLNHTERDINQKKQLIEFYKKKLDEISEKEKNEAIGEDLTSSSENATQG